MYMCPCILICMLSADDCVLWTCPIVFQPVECYSTVTSFATSDIPIQMNEGWAWNTSLDYKSNDVLNNKSKFCQQLDLIDTNEHIVTLSYLITPLPIWFTICERPWIQWVFGYMSMSNVHTYIHTFTLVHTIDVKYKLPFF